MRLDREGGCRLSPVRLVYFYSTLKYLSLFVKNIKLFPMVHFMFECLRRDSCVAENFNAQINLVFDCVTCNSNPYLQITTVYSSSFGSLTEVN